MEKEIIFLSLYPVPRAIMVTARRRHACALQSMAMTYA